MFPALLSVLRYFQSDRQKLESHAFEIYLELLSASKDGDRYQLACMAFDAALQFRRAFEDNTIGLEDIAKLRKGD
jgi:hypothetical protein